MKKNKKVLIASFIVVVLLAACAFLGGSYFLKKHNSFMENAEKIISVYSDSKIDFVVPSPSVQQLENMEKEEHINGVYPCYVVYTDFIMGTKNLSTYLMLVDNTEDLEKTMFKSGRIKSDSGALGENSLLIDEVFASQHGLKLGDSVKWSITATQTVDLVVDRIYYANVIDNNQVAVLCQGKQKSIIDEATKDNPLVPNGAYIDSSDLEKTDAMLKGYKPLGRMKSYEDFDTYTEYEEYLADFNSQDHYSQITKTLKYELENAPKAQEYEKNAVRYSALFLVMMAVLSILLPLTVDFATKSKSQFVSMRRDGASYKSTMKLLVSSKVATALISSAFTVAVSVLMLGKFTLYCVLSALPCIIGLAVCLAILAVSVKKEIKVKKNEG